MEIELCLEVSESPCDSLREIMWTQQLSFVGFSQHCQFTSHFCVLQNIQMISIRTHHYSNAPSQTNSVDWTDVTLHADSAPCQLVDVILSLEPSWRHMGWCTQSPKQRHSNFRNGKHEAMDMERQKEKKYSRNKWRNELFFITIAFGMIFLFLFSIFKLFHNRTLTLTLTIALQHTKTKLFLSIRFSSQQLINLIISLVFRGFSVFTQAVPVGCVKNNKKTTQKCTQLKVRFNATRVNETKRKK